MHYRPTPTSDCGRYDVQLSGIVRIFRCRNFFRISEHSFIRHQLIGRGHARGLRQTFPEDDLVRRPIDFFAEGHRDLLRTSLRHFDLHRRPSGAQCFTGMKLQLAIFQNTTFA